MYIKLSFKSETEKAYQLNNGSYIPKSILDKRGLEHPFYKIKNWWLDKLIDKNLEQTHIDSQKVLLALELLIIKFSDIPEEIQNKWFRYWDGSSNMVEMEPNIWGNDCLPGEMSSWF